MEKVLLLNPPGDKLYQRDMYCSAVSKASYYWPAIDLLILSGILGGEYAVDVIDAVAEKIPVGKCLARIRDGGYRAVVFLTGTASWKQDFAFMAGVRAPGSPHPLLIGNGDILLHKAGQFMAEYPFLDAVLFDYTSPDILNYLAGRSEDIAAMAFRRGADIEMRRKDVRPMEFSYPVPHHAKFPLRRYLLAQGKRFPFTTVQMSFGCPFRCTFCVAATLGYKYRSVDNVLEELRHVAGLGIREVFFTDFTFEARRSNALELCRRMALENIDLTWTCSSRANTLDEELLAAMKRAGCHTLLIGVESGDEEILKTYSKGVSKDDVRRAFALCRRLGIRTLGHFIIGLPGETEDTVLETLRFAKELDCDFASFNIAVPALGTPLREKAVKNGWLKDTVLEFDSSASFPVIETPEFSKEQAWRWRNRAMREFYFRPSRLWKMAAGSMSPYQWRILVRNGLAVARQAFGKG